MYAFFLSINERIYKSYTNLFGNEGGNNEGGEQFFRVWGWQYSSKLVADHENISLSETYNLKIFHYLNTLAYIKDYNKLKEAEHKRWRMKQGYKG